MLTGQIGLRRFGAGVIPRGIEWATYSHTHHCVVAISEEYCVSAEPGGVRIRAIADYPRLDWSSFELTKDQRESIARIGLAFVASQVKYNYAIYPPLLWQRLTGHKVDGWVAKWLSWRSNENCSQLSDDIYTKAGFHLFPNIPELVTPGDFERYFQSRGWLAPRTGIEPVTNRLEGGRSIR